MSGDRYFITDQNATYFLTFTVVEWIDIFTRKDYKHIIADSLNYCIEHKNLECFAWVLMSNHLHLLVRANPPARISDVIRDFKKFTSKKIIETIITIGESRKEWLLHKFEHAAHTTGRAEHYKVWKDDNHAILIEGNMFRERLDYIHRNPVEQLIVANECDYLFGSAYDYAGKKGLVKVTIG